MARRAAPVAFDVVCKAWGLPVPVAELRFAPPRRWRFDWAWPHHSEGDPTCGGVALEVPVSYTHLTLPTNREV